MKIRLLFIGIWIFYGTIVHAGERYPIPAVVLDYQYEYVWDDLNDEWTQTGTWSNPERVEYYYDDTGRLVREFVFNIETGENVRQGFYTYDESGLLVYSYGQIWEDDMWINNIAYTYTYNGGQFPTTRQTQNWIDGTWVNTARRVNIRYNEAGSMTHFDYQVWQNESWVDEAFEDWIYDEEGKLQERINILSNGTNRYRFTYQYDADAGTFEFVYQVWWMNGWANRVHRTTYYDDCGYASEEILQNWTSDEWLNSKKKEYFFTYNPALRWVPVCHRGHTLWVSKNAVNSHLRHGDCLGACEAVADDDYIRDHSKRWNKHKRATKIKQGRRKAKGGSNMNFKSDNITTAYGNRIFMEHVWGEDDDVKYLEKIGIANVRLPGMEKNSIVDTNDSRVILYPNPVRNGVLNILLDKDETFTTLEVLDLTGRILKSVNLKSQSSVTLDCSDLNHGAYLIRLTGESLITKKIMVQ